MSIITFKKGCRTCQQTDGINDVIIDYNRDLEYYKNVTDFDESLNILEWLRNNQILCNYCKDSNFDISNIKVDDYPLFSYSRLEEDYEKSGKEFFTINVTKKETKINPDLGGNDDNSDNFLKLCKLETFKHINSFGPTHFKQHDNGVFFICFSGIYPDVQLEKFRFSGFRQDQLVTLTEIIFKNLYI